MNSHPTSWAAAFAERHGLLLRYEISLPGQVPAYKYRDGDAFVVVLDADLPAERQHFSLAHEAAHLLLGHEGEVHHDEEAEANRLAAELLLPDPPFGSDVHHSLDELKELHPHASYEALARRRLAFVPGVVTIVDNGHVVRRLRADGFAAPDRMTDPEWALVRDSIARHAGGESLIEGVAIRTTYVDDGRGVVRVLVEVNEA